MIRSRLRRAVVLLGVSGALLVPPVPCASAPAPNAAAEAAALRARGLDLAYNLDYDQALDAFRAAIAVAPDDPGPSPRRGDHVDQVVVSAGRGAGRRLPRAGDGGRQAYAPSPEFDALFREHIEKARSLSGDRAGASAEYEVAVRLCRAHNDVPCANGAGALIKRRRAAAH